MLVETQKSHLEVISTSVQARDMQIGIPDRLGSTWSGFGGPPVPALVPGRVGHLTKVNFGIRAEESSTVPVRMNVSCFLSGTQMLGPGMISARQVSPSAIPPGLQGPSREPIPWNGGGSRPFIPATS